MTNQSVTVGEGKSIIQNNKAGFRKNIIRYILVFGVLYLLPAVFHVIYTFVVAVSSGFVPAIPGMLLVGSMVFSPFYGVYYVVLSFAHSIFDSLVLYREVGIGWRFLINMPALASSAVLIVGCMILFMGGVDGPFTTAGIIIMIVGFIAVTAVTGLRIYANIGMLVKKVIEHQNRK